MLTVHNSNTNYHHRILSLMKANIQEDEERVRDYLESVYNSIVLKDIIAREKVRNVRFLEKLIR